MRTIGRLLAEEKLDIAVLNEVDFNVYWSHGINQAEVIARDAGFLHILQQRNADIFLPFRTLRFGNAVLSRFPLSDAKFLRLPVLKQAEDIFGGAHHSAIVNADVPELGKVTIIPIHLEVRDEDIRIAAAETVLSQFDATSRTIVLGDFNSAPTPAGTTALDTFLKSQKLSPAGGRVEGLKTFPDHAPTLRIDWILKTPTLTASDFAVHATGFSDHALIICTIAKSQL